ncbi:hypothetical protein [Rheinheimera texasensis]|uniref:hypothetical protein n=1 Tax=Rheinheimera texasensis TaxID=306205 RepID=UPI0032B1A265
MNALVTHYEKTEALKQLEKFFPHFSLAVSPSEIAFLYDCLDVPGDESDIISDPFGFLLRDLETGAVVLFSGGDNDSVICHGVFAEPQGAFDLACDYIGAELHITEFAAISIPALSTESVDN